MKAKKNKFKRKVFDGNVRLGGQSATSSLYVDTNHLVEITNDFNLGKLLIYHKHAVEQSAVEGNRRLLEVTADCPKFIPQFVINPFEEDLEWIRSRIKMNQVKSVRLFPKKHRYPFSMWAIDNILDWASNRNISIWIPIDEVELDKLYTIGSNYPNIWFVLTEVHYTNFIETITILRNLPNMMLLLSHFDVGDGITKLVDEFGSDKLIYGSGYPDLAMGPYYYYLKNSDLNHCALNSILHENLEKLLAI